MSSHYTIEGISRKKKNWENFIVFNIYFVHNYASFYYWEKRRFQKISTLLQHVNVHTLGDCTVASIDVCGQTSNKHLPLIISQLYDGGFLQILGWVQRIVLRWGRVRGACAWRCRGHSCLEVFPARPCMTSALFSYEFFTFWMHPEDIDGIMFQKVYEELPVLLP